LKTPNNNNNNRSKTSPSPTKTRNLDLGFPSIKNNGQIELPTCPVCLERMDETVTGIVSILCNHSFHCKCLAKWKESNSCPVCRYSDQLDCKDTMCQICKSTESLWICLVCGFIGCGRYINEHARIHFKETNHTYALDLQTNRVWDYSGDCYVHRLAQNKDGKIVQITGISSSEDQFPEVGKLESISLEYTYLMETQKRFFDQQLKRLEREKLSKVTHLEEEYAFLMGQLELQNKRIQELENEKKKRDQKISNLEKRTKKIWKKLNS